MLDHPLTPFDFRRQLQLRSVYDVAPEMRRQTKAASATVPQHRTAAATQFPSS